MDRKVVLGVDDNDDILKMLQIRTEAEGYEFIPARDGEDMLNLLNNGKKPDIIILDIMLPKMDGYSALREMRKEDAFKDIPVIVLTAKKKEEVGSLFALEDIACFMEKPFRFDELFKKIKDIVG
ncbi:MAG: response regulator [Candidatus Omnitrophota bacterium]